MGLPIIIGLAVGAWFLFATGDDVRSGKEAAADGGAPDRTPEENAASEASAQAGETGSEPREVPVSPGTPTAGGAQTPQAGVKPKPPVAEPFSGVSTGDADLTGLGGSGDAGSSSMFDTTPSDQQLTAELNEFVDNGIAHDVRF